MSSKAKKILCICAGIIIVAVCVIIFVMSAGKEDKNKSTVRTEPTVTIKTPEKINDNDFSVDVTVSSLGDAIYPAVSMCIDFDSEYLELQGVKNGNVKVMGNTSDGQIPEWNIDTGYSNETGKINIMYLDVSGGKYAFSDSFLNDRDNILFTLDFSLKDNAESGNIYEFDIEDAVFATSDSKKSLAVNSGTLKTQNGKIILED